MIHFLSELLLKELTMQIWFDGLFRDFFFSSLFVDLPYLHLLPAYKVMRLFSLSQYEILIFYVLTLWTVCFCWCKKEKKPLCYHCNVASAWFSYCILTAAKVPPDTTEADISFLYNSAIKKKPQKCKHLQLDKETVALHL